MDLPEKWICQKNGFAKVGYHHEIAIHKTSYDYYLSWSALSQQWLQLFKSAFIP
jgi:hypothetical protein